MSGGAGWPEGTLCQMSVCNVPQIYTVPLLVHCTHLGAQAIAFVGIVFMFKI